MNQSNEQAEGGSVAVRPSLVVTSAAGVRGALTPAGQRPGADSGDPQIAFVDFDTSGNGRAGVWECDPGGWPIPERADSEVSVILEGVVTVTDDATGETHRLEAGDVIFMPAGWSGRWDVNEHVRKVFAIY